MAVVAHAQHGRLDLVAETVGELPPALADAARRVRREPPASVTESRSCGALLLALAMVDLDRGTRTGDARAAGRRSG